MSDLYDSDILLWSERQADLLRRHAAVARENDAIDWPNVIEEIDLDDGFQKYAMSSVQNTVPRTGERLRRRHRRPRR